MYDPTSESSTFGCEVRFMLGSTDTAVLKGHVSGKRLVKNQVTQFSFIDSYVHIYMYDNSYLLGQDKTRDKLLVKKYWNIVYHIKNLKNGPLL